MSHQDKLYIEPGYYQIKDSIIFIDKTGDMYELDSKMVNSQDTMAQDDPKAEAHTQKAIESMREKKKVEYSRKQKRKMEKGVKKQEKRTEKSTAEYKKKQKKPIEELSKKEKKKAVKRSKKTIKQEAKERSSDFENTQNLTKNNQHAIKNKTRKKSDVTMDNDDNEIEIEIEEDTADVNNKDNGDPKDLGDDYDPENPKETSAKKRPVDEEDMTFDLESVKKLISEEVAAATKTYKQTIEDLLNEKEEAKQAEDLKVVLTQPPYGLDEDMVKGMAFNMLNQMKAGIDGTKLFKDFVAQSKPIEITHEDVNKEILAQAEDFIAGARAKYWGNVMHLFSKEGS